MASTGSHLFSVLQRAGSLLTTLVNYLPVGFCPWETVAGDSKVKENAFLCPVSSGTCKRQQQTTATPASYVVFQRSRASDYLQSGTAYLWMQQLSDTPLSSAASWVTYTMHASTHTFALSPVCSNITQLHILQNFCFSSPFSTTITKCLH